MITKLQIYSFLCGITFYSLSVSSQTSDIDYLGLTPPGNTPEIFAPGRVSVSGRVEERPFFLNEGKWFIYQTNNFNYDDERKHIITMNTDGVWGEAMAITDTILLSNGNLGATITDKFIAEGGFTDTNFTIYVTQISDEIWEKTDTIKLNVAIPYWCGIVNLTLSGNIYFSVSKDNIGRYMDLYKSELIDGEYQDPVLVLTNAQLSFLSPDEEYIIFEKIVGGGPDLKIVFNNGDNTWTSPMDLGDEINTNCAETMPVVSPDGKYLFFTRWNTSQSCLSDAAELMWVEIESTIETLKPAISAISNKITDFETTIFPNPANHILYVKNSDFPHEYTHYCLTNSSGSIVSKGILTDNSIPISELKNGIYVLQLFSENKFASRKVVIE